MKTKAVSSILVLLVMSLVVSCSDDDNPDPPVHKDKGLPDTAIKDQSVDSVLPDKAPKPDTGPSAKICGTVTDSAGKTLAKVAVTSCGEHECADVTTGATGQYCFTLVLADDYGIHAWRTKVNGVQLGDVFFPVKVT